VRWPPPSPVKPRISGDRAPDGSDIARATSANETTVRAWLRDERSPSGDHAERLAELSSIVERLVLVMQANYVPVWMRKPIPLLDDDKPLDVIAAGAYRRCLPWWPVWKPLARSSVLGRRLHGAVRDLVASDTGR